MKLLFLIFLILNLSINSAKAYIEPGIVSMFFQAIIAAVIAVFAYITLYWHKFKNFINKLFKRKNREK